MSRFFKLILALCVGLTMNISYAQDIRVFLNESSHVDFPAPDQMRTCGVRVELPSPLMHGQMMEVFFDVYWVFQPFDLARIFHHSSLTSKKGMNCLENKFILKK